MRVAGNRVPLGEKWCLTFLYTTASRYLASATTFNIADGYAEYQMALSSRDSGAKRRLAKEIPKNENVLEFRLAPSRD